MIIKYLAISSDNHNHYFNSEALLSTIASVKVKLGQYKEADVLYTQAIASYGLQPIPLDTLVNAASTKLELGQYKEADALFTKLIASYGNKPVPESIQTTAASVKVKLSQHKEASKAHNKH